MLESFGLRVEGDLLAADQELDRLVEAVEEAREGGDECGLLRGRAELEAGAVRGQESAVRPVAELDEACVEDACDGEVEWCDARPRRAPGERVGEPVGGEHLVFGGDEVAGCGERELVAAEAVAADERERQAGCGDEPCDRDRERDREHEHEAEQLVDAVGDDGGAGEDEELLAGEPERESVFEVDVGGHFDRDRLLGGGHWPITEPIARAVM